MAEAMEYDLLRDPDVKEFSGKYVCVKIDRDTETAKNLRIKRPTLLILRTDGKVIRKFTRPTHPKKFIAVVRKLR